MKKLLVTLAMCVSTGVLAAHPTSVDVSTLTPEQIQKINQQVSEMSNNPMSVSATVRKEAAAWGDLGANMGKALVSAAREVGVASNEFASTSLGKVVVAIVTYKIVGKDILGVVFGTLTLLFGWSVAIWLLTTRRFADVKYEYEPVFKGLFKRKRIVSISQDSNTTTNKMIAAGFVVLLSTIAGLNLIF
jgi:hypothetical protein